MGPGSSPERDCPSTGAWACNAAGPPDDQQGKRGRPMRLNDYLDKGASLGPNAPCLTPPWRTLSYGHVQRLSGQIAGALARSGVRAGDKVAILSANDPAAFSCVFGISRAGAVWCPVNPRREAAENRDLLDLFDCRCLIFQAAFGPLVAKIVPDLPQLTTLVCLDGDAAGALSFREWIGAEAAEPEPAGPLEPGPAGPGVGESGAGGSGAGAAGAAGSGVRDDLVMLVGTGGTTGRPKGVMLTGG